MSNQLDKYVSNPMDPAIMLQTIISLQKQIQVLSRGLQELRAELDDIRTNLLESSPPPTDAPRTEVSRLHWPRQKRPLQKRPLLKPKQTVKCLGANELEQWIDYVTRNPANIRQQISEQLNVPADRLDLVTNTELRNCFDPMNLYGITANQLGRAMTKAGVHRHSVPIWIPHEKKQQRMYILMNVKKWQGWGATGYIANYVGARYAI